VPKRIAEWNPARCVWETGQGQFCGHLAVFSETWPISGMTRGGVAYELPTSALLMAGSAPSLLPTPLSVPSSEASHNQLSGTFRAAMDKALSLLPTPAAYDGERGGPQDPAKRKAGGHSVTLQDAVHVLLPTPKTTDSHHSSPADMARNEPGLRAIGRLLPTPRATDGTKGGPNQRGSSGDLMLPSAVQLLPTPIGARTNPRFDAGSTSQDELPLPPQSEAPEEESA
jgi:DNA (cytosine-5)-methyltransferase 1